MTTFKSPRSSNNIEIQRHLDTGHIILEAESTHAVVVVELAPSDAAAIALAVLDAGGIEPRAHEGYSSADHQKVLEDAAWEIRRVVKHRTESAEILGDAMDLYRHAFPNDDCYETMDAMPHHLSCAWVRVARRARELAQKAGQ